jgi:hypothetical protein
MRKAIKKKENKNHKMKEETDDFHHFVFLNGQILLPTNYGLFFFLSLKPFVFSIFFRPATDAVLLGVAEPQSGKQRVRHLPVQALVTQQAETWTGGVRIGKRRLSPPAGINIFRRREKSIPPLPCMHKKEGLGKEINLNSFMMLMLFFVLLCLRRITGGTKSTQKADGTQMGVYRHASGRTGIHKLLGSSPTLHHVTFLIDVMKLWTGRNSRNL